MHVLYPLLFVHKNNIKHLGNGKARTKLIGAREKVQKTKDTERLRNCHDLKYTNLGFGRIYTTLKKKKICGKPLLGCLGAEENYIHACKSCFE